MAFRPVFSGERTGGLLKPAIEEVTVPVEPNPLDGLFQAWHGLVFRTAYRITGNAADAEDVLQTVFLRLARRPDAPGEIANPEGYFRRAAVNASLDVVRARAAAPTMPLDERIAGAAPHDAELRTAIRRALATLDPAVAEMFALRYFEDIPNQRIAEILGMSQVRVAVTLFRARQRLRKELAGSLQEGHRG